MNEPLEASIRQLHCQGLLTDDQLPEAEVLARACHGAPEELLASLVRRGWLTRFQSERLARGQVSEVVLDQYILLDLIGAGGMGQVFKARQRRMNRLVALKVVRAECLMDPDAVVRFRREAESAARLSHPNIVTVFDCNEANGTYFIVMEYIEGTDLAQCLRRHGAFPVAAACDSIRQAALGLQHVHEQGMVHRDIKPHNLMLNRHGFIKVMDMGLARTAAGGDKLNESLTVTGAVMGTPDFMSPEQAMNSKGVDIRTDIFSLGCSLYYLLTAMTPYPGNSLTEKLLKRQLQDATPIGTHRADLPAGLPEVIHRMLARQVADRQQTPAEVASALEPYCQGALSSLVELARKGEPSRAPSKPELPTVLPPTRTAEVEVLAAALQALPSTVPPQAQTVAGPPAAMPATIGPPAATPDSIAEVPTRTPPPNGADAPMPSRAGPAIPDSATGVHQPEVEEGLRRRRPWPALVGVLLLASMGFGVLAAWLLKDREGSVSTLTVGSVGSSLANVGTGSAPAPRPTTPALPPTPPTKIATPRHVALLVGVGDYRLHHLEALPFADQDMTALKKALQDADFPAEGVQLLTTTAGDEDPKRTPGEENVRKELDKLRRKDQTAESVLVALAGQVIQFEGETETYFCPSDANLVDRQTLIGLSEIYQALQECPARFKLLLIDGCRSRPVTKKAPSTAKKLMEVARPQSPKPPEGVAVLFACSAGETSWDHSADPAQGVFFWLVAQALRQPNVSLEDYVRVRAFEYVFSTYKEQPAHQTPERRGTTAGKPFLPSLRGLTAPAPVGEIFATEPGFHKKKVTSVAVAPDGRYAFSVSEDGNARRWDLRDMKFAGTLETSVPGPIWGIAAAPDARHVLLVTGGTGTSAKPSLFNSAVYLFTCFPEIAELDAIPAAERPNDPLNIDPERRHTDFVTSVAVAPDNSRAATGSYDKTVRLWTFANGTLKAGRALKGHSNRVHSVAFAPTGKWLVSGGSDQLVLVWDQPNDKSRPLKGHTGSIRGVAVSPDGKLVASASEDGTACLWDAVKGSKLITFAEHEEPVLSIAFSPDGESVLTAGADRMVRLWDRNGKQLEVFKGHDKPVTSVAFTPDGRRAVSGSEDQTVRVWALPRSAAP